MGDYDYWDDDYWDDDYWDDYDNYHFRNSSSKENAEPIANLYLIF